LHDPVRFLTRISAFRITFGTAEGERMGIVAYAFLANNRETKGRPPDEHRFQRQSMDRRNKDKSSNLHELWQDPYGLLHQPSSWASIQSLDFLSEPPCLATAPL